ncbi:DUF1853 family protein [Celerinatantimonas diazotrophica]|uniref:DUF1853 family protein n=1 Tax=Celerinatantimonas diazotrophica TaxID=412034 RepID=A0A4R1JAL4_9GAMM|nr:DUF1853 family protein [Celerinatantimonas diazotrophica]TCK47696.1 hypothetical protein EV690_2741 [Celerinatantimonas diazotrophica]CAG9296680.1 hypothetical protein CEDIAZO_01834 [Celerinatantimonas diazotrophica]
MKLSFEQEHIKQTYQYCLSCEPISTVHPAIATIQQLSWFTQSLPSLPATLPDFQPRLGLWYEQLWLKLIDCHPDLELIAYNRQIIEQNQTIGAIDLLVADHQHRCVRHIELAVKFYIYFQLAQKWQWIGPNLKDRFTHKLSRMLTHQLPMGYHPQIQQLRLRYPNYHFNQQIILQGRLFQPCSAPRSPKDGTWLFDSQLNVSERYLYQIVPRQYWLTPSHAAYQPLTTNIDRAVMVYGQGKQFWLLPDNYMSTYNG